MGFQSYKKRLLRSAKNVYKKFDIYSKDLTLTFNGDDKHTTYVGATFSIFIMVYMMVYALIQVEVMFKRQRSTINVKSIYTDLTKNYENVSMSDNGFDFAMQFKSGSNYDFDLTYF